MIEMKQNLSIFNKFNFERKPVGVKFRPTKPEGLEKLNQVLDFCEMLKEAQEGGPFYATKEEFTCIGPMLLGMVDHDPIFESGMVGPKLGVFQDSRANRRLYDVMPRLKKDTVNYVLFSPLDKLTFDPDLLILTTNTSQAEVLLRAHSYRTGKIWSTRGTPVAACTWVYIYPYVSGELTFTVTGFSFGMKSRRLFPEGMILMSIPWDLLPGMIQSLQEMEWVPHSFTIGREEHKKKVKRIINELKQEFPTV
jgi:uncharacterized protein (DUF169 family)